jgi:predicted dehydrogenase
MKIGVVGLGYWGTHLIRYFLSNEKIDKIVGFDKDQERNEYIKTKFPEIIICKSFQEMLRSEIDAVAITTNVISHYSFAKAALEAGKHIWIEKPYTTSSSQALELNRIADKKGLNIFIDDTSIYTSTIKKIKELINNNELGEVIYFDSERIDFGFNPQDESTRWQSLHQDVSIMRYLIPSSTVVAITSETEPKFSPRKNSTNASVYFKNSCFGHINVAWQLPLRMKKITITGKKRMLIYDDFDNQDKIKIYDYEIELNEEKIKKPGIKHRLVDVFFPVMQTEALSLAVKEFSDSISEKRKPISSGLEGYQTIRLLEGIKKSKQYNGVLIKLRDNQNVDGLMISKKYLSQINLNTQ